MKITMLGTAAIGYPLTFCNCVNCKNARIHGGKSIRKRASMLINDDLLIDIGPDVQTAMTMYNKDMSKVKYLLQTHIHTDHYDEGLLCTRRFNIIKDNEEKLEIFAHPTCLQIMSDRVNKFEPADLITKEGSEKLNVHSNEVNSGDIFTFGNYKVKAIESTHDVRHGSLTYLISDGIKNIFYATDTMSFTDDALIQIKDIKLDLLIMDHSYGNIEDSYKHLNEKLFIEQIDILRKINCIDDNTKIFGTHISHNGNPYHEEAENRAIKNGYHIAYDGMELEI